MADRGRTNVINDEPDILDLEEMLGDPRPKQTAASKEKRAKNGGGNPPLSLEELKALPVHPIAAMFPMLAEDELADLAADIQANGVKHPIVITRDGQIVDGRNRIAACAMVDVEPPIEYFDPGDLSGAEDKAKAFERAVAGFVISANVNRRHLSKSQRAMAVAVAFPEPAKLKRDSSSFVPKNQGFSDASFSKARTVVRLAPDLADQVLAGAMQIDEAYTQASLRKSDSDRRKDRINKLAKANSELAEAVSNGIMAIEEAEKKVREAAEELRVSRWAATKNICDPFMMLNLPPDTAGHHAALFDPALAEHLGQPITPEKFDRVAAYVVALKEAFLQMWEEPPDAI